LFLTFRDLFCAVSSEDQDLKDWRTDEHYGIERTAAFDTESGQKLSENDGGPPIPATIPYTR
jgi:hypothetical protein